MWEATGRELVGRVQEMAREGPGLSAPARVQARPGDAPATGTVFRDSSKIGLKKRKTTGFLF